MVCYVCGVCVWCVVSVCVCVVSVCLCVVYVWCVMWCVCVVCVMCMVGCVCGVLCVWCVVCVCVVCVWCVCGCVVCVCSVCVCVWCVMWCVCVCVLGSPGTKPIGTPCILGWRSFLPTEKRDSWFSPSSLPEMALGGTVGLGSMLPAGPSTAQPVDCLCVRALGRKGVRCSHAGKGCPLPVKGASRCRTGRGT